MRQLTKHGPDHVELRSAGPYVAPTRFDRDAFIRILFALRGGIFLRVVATRPIDASVADGGDDRSYHVFLVFHGFPEI